MKLGKLIAGFLLVGVLVFFALRELKQDQQQGKRRAEEQVFPYASSKVVVIALTLREEGKHAVWARDTAGQWRLKEGPEGTNTAVAPELVGSWSRVRFKEVVEEQPADLERYGLKLPLATLTATVKPTEPAEAPVEAALYIGNPAEPKPAFYAKVDGFERVVLVSVDVTDILGGIGRQAFGLESTIPDPNHRE